MITATEKTMSVLHPTQKQFQKEAREKDATYLEAVQIAARKQGTIRPRAVEKNSAQTKRNSSTSRSRKQRARSTHPEAVPTSSSQARRNPSRSR